VELLGVGGLLRVSRLLGDHNPRSIDPRAVPLEQSISGGGGSTTGDRLQSLLDKCPMGLNDPSVHVVPAP
jgi:hypothetical protein